MKLSEAIPWGRTLEEYRSMFDLSECNLRRKILACADGPSSFNSELSATGGKVISIDPVYEFDAQKIMARIDEVYPVVMQQIRETYSSFVWSKITSVEMLGRIRMQAMNAFLNDFEQGKIEGRYQSGSLPRLGFEKNTFSLALCSHFLFLYSDHFDASFHIQSLLEMNRVAQEVRVYPLYNLDGTLSVHLDEVQAALAEHGLCVEIRKVEYEFQKGANEIMVIKGSSGQC